MYLESNEMPILQRILSMILANLTLGENQIHLDHIVYKKQTSVVKLKNLRDEPDLHIPMRTTTPIIHDSRINFSILLSQVHQTT
jgi:hypothetical protein